MSEVLDVIPTILVSVLFGFAMGMHWRDMTKREK